MAFKNLTPDQQRELSAALGPEFNAQQQQQLMNFADALFAKPEKAKSNEKPNVESEAVIAKREAAEINKREAAEIKKSQAEAKALEAKEPKVNNLKVTKRK